MLKYILLCAAFAAPTVLGPRVAQAEMLPQAASSSADETLFIDYTYVFTPAEPVANIETVSPGVLEAMSAWLSANFELPASAVPPHVEFVSPARMAALRYKQIIPFQEPAESANGAASPGVDQDMIAVYDDHNEFIYLLKGWSGKSPGEMSVLVHEMVHHLQNHGKLKYGCPQEREKLAYAAQSRWLIEFGTSLEEEFGIDPFTLLVKVNCIN